MIIRSTIFILLIWGNSNISPMAVEFYNEAACRNAEVEIGKHLPSWVTTLCLPKEVIAK